MTIAAVVVALVIVGAYFFTDGFHFSSGSKPTVLVQAGTSYPIPGLQFNAIAINVQKTSMISGTFTNTEGITLYTMTPSELLSLSKTGVVGTYDWTSGRIANLTVTNLDLSFQPGGWDLVFYNTNGPTPYPLTFPNYNTTYIGFYTDLTLSSG